MKPKERRQQSKQSAKQSEEEQTDGKLEANWKSAKEISVKCKKC